MVICGWFQVIQSDTCFFSSVAGKKECNSTISNIPFIPLTHVTGKSRPRKHLHINTSVFPFLPSARQQDFITAELRYGCLIRFPIDETGRWWPGEQDRPCLNVWGLQNKYQQVKSAPKQMCARGEVGYLMGTEPHKDAAVWIYTILLKELLAKHPICIFFRMSLQQCFWSRAK